MHALAITLGDPDASRFMPLAMTTANIADAFIPADRAAFIVGSQFVIAHWLTGGAPAVAAPAAPAPNIIVNIPERRQEAVALLQDKFNYSSGKYSAERYAIMEALCHQGPASLTQQAIRRNIEALCHHPALTDTDIREISTGTLLSIKGIDPSNVLGLRQRINSRLTNEILLPEIDAYREVLGIFSRFVNPAFADQLTQFTDQLKTSLDTEFPTLRRPLFDVIKRFLEDDVCPLLNGPSSPADPLLPRLIVLCNNFLNHQTLFETLMSMQATTTTVTAQPRGHGGAQTGPPRAGGGAGNHGAGGGGGGGGPAAPVTRYPAPPNRVIPEEYTVAPGPFQRPASGCDICFASQSTLGRCPYAVCNKQHSWQGVTPAEKSAITAWLAVWLKKRRWDMYIKWCSSGGNPATWPALCN